MPIRLPPQLLCVLTMFAAAASAVHAAPCESGVWVGTLGKTPVVLELGRKAADDRLAGRFYVRTLLTDRVLVRDEKDPRRWVELGPDAKPVAQLTLDCGQPEEAKEPKSSKTTKGAKTAKGKDARAKEGKGASAGRDASPVLSGEWRSLDGKQKQAIRARPGKAYDERRLQALKPIAGKAQGFGPGGYQPLTVPGVDAVRGLRLQGKARGIAAINRRLAERMEQAVGTHLDCVAQGQLRYGKEHGFEHNAMVSVLAWNRDWVVLGFDENGYCGGAHPFHGSRYEVSAVTSGQAQDLKDWMLPSSRGELAKDSPLRAELIRRYQAGTHGKERQCVDAVGWRGEDFHPLPEGLVFHTAAAQALSACVEDVIVPWPLMQAYLTPEAWERTELFRAR